MCKKVVKNLHQDDGDGFHKCVVKYKNPMYEGIPLELAVTIPGWSFTVNWEIVKKEFIINCPV